MGIGNILFKDEGLGVYASLYLQQNYDFSPAVELIDGGTMGMNMIHIYQSYQQLIILDTISVEGTEKAGSVYCLNADVLQGLGNCRKTAHEIEVLQTLELASLAGEMAEIQIIAMVPEQIDEVTMALTPTVLDAMPTLIETTLNYLEKWGVQCAPKSSAVSWQTIIETYHQQKAPPLVSFGDC